MTNRAYKYLFILAALILSIGQLCPGGCRKLNWILQVGGGEGEDDVSLYFEWSPQYPSKNDARKKMMRAKI